MILIAKDSNLHLFKNQGMIIRTINLCNFKTDGGAMFGLTPKSIWEKGYPADKNNLCLWALRIMLIESGNSLILVDSGFSPDLEPNLRAEYHIEEITDIAVIIERLGYSTNFITDLVTTHFHLDHCGGAFKIPKNGKPEPVFKNATYWASRYNMGAALNPSRFEKDSFQENIAKAFFSHSKVKLLEGNYRLKPEIELKQFYGHTKGLLLPFVKTETENVIFGGDLFPTQLHIDTNVIAAYDVLPAVTVSEKSDLLLNTGNEHFKIYFQHDYYNEFKQL